MKLFNWIFALFIISPSIIKAASFSSDDLEIFKLQNELIKETSDPKINFYSYLSLQRGPNSNYDEITKAYKKLSRKFHPDKFHGKSKKEKKVIEERFQRLSLIGTILRSEKKDIYDYYYKVGFPTLKNNDFTFNRFKPGLILTLIVIFILVSLIHYMSISLMVSQEKKRIQSLINTLKSKANFSPSPTGSIILTDKKVFHLNKWFLVKFDGTCYLIDKPTEEGIDYEVDDDGNIQYYDEQEIEDEEYREPRNRRERRTKKKNSGGSKNKDHPLLPVDTNDVKDVLFLRDFLGFRFPVWLWNCSLGKLSSMLYVDLPALTEPAAVGGVGENDAGDEEQQEEVVSQKKSKNKGDKITLPNGKVIYGRKRK